MNLKVDKKDFLVLLYRDRNLSSWLKYVGQRMVLVKARDQMKVHVYKNEILISYEIQLEFLS